MTIQSFICALLTPDLSFTTLVDSRVRTGDDGLPVLMRTTRFVEAQITWHDEQWLLSMPLTRAAMPSVERIAPMLRRFTTDHLTPYRILPNEMRGEDFGNATQTSDLILQQFPSGCSLDEALLSVPPETLLAALEALRTELRRLDFTHNNLKASNLQWTGSRLIPLRYHNASIGSSFEADDQAFESLRSQITATPGPQTVCDTEAPYQPTNRLTGHLWVNHVFEGLASVHDQAGWGFVDTNNNPVIAPQYLWAGDFHEGRVEVETATGMGLIDREGTYIIPPEYEIVEYDPAQSTAQVRLNGLWAVFDHMGRRLTAFCERT